MPAGNRIQCCSKSNSFLEINFQAAHARMKTRALVEYKSPKAYQANCDPGAARLNLRPASPLLPHQILLAHCPGTRVRRARDLVRFSPRRGNILRLLRDSRGANFRLPLARMKIYSVLSAMSNFLSFAQLTVVYLRLRQSRAKRRLLNFFRTFFAISQKKTVVIPSSH